MPTYLNHGSYMKMNDFNKPYHDHREPYRDREVYNYSKSNSFEHNCLEILNHVQNCPICHHVFSPHENVVNGLKTTNHTMKKNMFNVGTFKDSVEISFTSLLLIISIFIVLILLIIRK